MKTIIKYGMLLWMVIMYAACEKKTDADGVLSPITNLENVRKLYKGTDVQLNTTVLSGASSIVGVVISDYQKGNVPSGLLIMQSARTSNVRGINIDLGNVAVNFLPGDSILVNINGALLTKQNGAMTIKNLSVDKITKVSSDNEPTVQIVSIADLNSAPDVYESTLVQINNVTFAQPYGQPFAGNKEFSDGGTTMFLHTEATAVFAAESLPKIANATGIVLVNDIGSGLDVKLWPRAAEEIVNTEDQNAPTADTPVIITGLIANPSGSDGNYEYIQLMATEDIDFADDNYSLIVYYGHSTDAKPHALGWVQGGIVTNSNGYTTTYKFNLTSGTVNKGEFFYVGGSGKTIDGSGTTDISSAKWIRSIAYVSTAGDGGVGIKTSGLFTNGSSINGIAVFSGTAVDQNTIPKDVVFFAGVLENDAPSRFYQSGPPELGYRICNNDLYSTANGAFFWSSTGNDSNDSYLNDSNIGSTSYFTKFGGVYNTPTHKWTTKRRATTVKLSSTSQLTVIETGTGITRIE